jgi:hypothetical protein
MSVMILTQLHYKSIESFLVNRLYRADRNTLTTLRKSNITTEYSIAALVNSWYRLNIQSYNERYRENVPIECVGKSNTISLTNLQALKAFHCIQYQIELPVSKDEAQKEQDAKDCTILEEIINELTIISVTDSDEYNKAQWCIERG